MSERQQPSPGELQARAAERFIRKAQHKQVSDVRRFTVGVFALAGVALYGAYDMMNRGNQLPRTDCTPAIEAAFTNRKTPVFEGYEPPQNDVCNVKIVDLIKGRDGKGLIGFYTATPKVQPEK